MPSDLAISARNLTKTYRVFGHPGDRIKQALSLGRMKFNREFTALKDVSFDIKKGETVGIIGHNGSGKSTLLQLICGILKPTSGSVKVNGRVSALLELGAGFNPEFTGRENVYFQAALMGFTQAEMAARFDGIAEFADIGEFIDQPVRTYSSGMFLRLAFAVAISVDPDVLVVDEALAVGDARFQAKCFRRFDALKDRGATILLVSHATEQIVRLCEKALLLHEGVLLANGDAGGVSTRYMELLFNRVRSVPEPGAGRDMDGDCPIPFAVNTTDEYFHLRGAYNPGEYRWGDQSARILDFRLSCAGAEHVSEVSCGQARLMCAIRVLFEHDVQRPIYGLVVKSREG
ncbi:MAG: ABC transporter ATP-binding protein, partial [Pseudomonadota bacterium]